MSEAQFALFLIQVLVVLGLARLLGELFRRFGHPPIAGEILAGILLGRTVLGSIAPELFAGLFPEDAVQSAAFEVVAQIGILFLLLLVGLEVDVSSAWKMRAQALGIAAAAVGAPLLIGAGTAWWLHADWAELPVRRLAFSLFVGTAVAIAGLTVVARLLFDLRIVKSDLGLLLISALALNELLGWLFVAVAVGLVPSAEGRIAPGAGALAIAIAVLGTLLFAGLCATAGRQLVTRILRWFEARGYPSPATPLSFVVCLALLCGVVTREIGVHPIFGFLIAGLMAGDQRALSEHTRSVITQMVEAVFVPLFFAGICLDVDAVADFDAPLVLGVAALSIGGKFAGAWIGTRIVRLPAIDRLPAAVAHTPGGAMGALLAVVGREVGIIGPEMFVAIVFASIASSLLVGPVLEWSLRRREVSNVLGFFHSRGVVPELVARTRWDAIDELAARAGELVAAPGAAEIASAVRGREETMGTGVGGGIAVPHARLDGLERPLVVLGRSREGIDWNAVDDEPAHLVFLILTPSDDAASQLQILSRIARGFAQEATRAEIQHEETPAGIWARLQQSLR